MAGNPIIEHYSMPQPQFGGESFDIAGTRIRAQATAAAELAARLGVTLHAAIYLHAPDAVLTRRLLDRASQSGRADDKADVIRHRLQVFAETTGQLVPYYAERGILLEVDADQPPDSVTTDIQARLSALGLSTGGTRS